MAKEENLLRAGDAHRRARDHRRPAAGRARLRRRDQPERHHRPEPAVRLLRRRRARPRLPRHGAGRRPRATSTSAGSAAASPVPAASSTSPRTPGRWSSPAPSPPAGCGSRPATARCASRRKGAAASSWPRSSRSPSTAAWPRRPGSRCSTSPSAACSELTPAGLELVEVAPGIDLERDILALMDFRPLVARSQAHGRAAVPRGGDGPRGHAARPPAGRPVHPRPGPLDAVHRFRRLPRAARGAGRGGARAGARRWSSRSAARSRR